MHRKYHSDRMMGDERRAGRREHWTNGIGCRGARVISDRHRRLLFTYPHKGTELSELVAVVGTASPDQSYGPL